MTYQETLDWLFSQLPMYQNQGTKAYKKDLSNSLKLAEHLNNPHTGFKSIHVGGTNGKGSTSHMIASVLQEAGYKVGLYTSPHLKDFRERIRINGTPVSKDYVVDFVANNKSFFESNSLSFFEMTVGLAFQYFNEKKVDFGVIEVGLGGRLDSTNIITPMISVITNIGLDHMEYLGDTHESIALEKAGIIKTGVPVVIGETDVRTIDVFRKKALEMRSKLIQADQIERLKYYPMDVIGHYQGKNQLTALATLELLVEIGMELNESHLVRGFKNIISNTGLLGRWQVLDTNPMIIADTAHNYEGLELVMNQILQMESEHLHMVIGFVRDKDVNRLVSLFPKKAHYYLCQANVARSMDIDNLSKLFTDHELKNSVFNSVIEAFHSAKERAGNNDLIFVGGSTFVVAEVL